LAHRQSYKPHPGRQTDFLKSSADWIFYGGARGGGKSFTLAWKAGLTPRQWEYSYGGSILTKEEAKLLTAAGKEVKLTIKKISIDYPDYIALLIRRTYPQLERNLKPECEKLYRLYGGTWQERNKCYVFPSGAKIYMVHLQDSKAKDNYIGGNYNFIGVDEANQFPESWIREISTSVRTDNPELKPQICLTSNPGNIGHLWLKRMFVEKCKPIAAGEKVYDKEFDIVYQPQKPGLPYIDGEGISYHYIPATVFDNPTLIENDKKYVRQLKNLNPTLKAMWLHGSWDVFAGMFFDNWSIMHHTIPQKNFIYGKHFDKKTHSLYRFYDYGTKNPFVCLYAAVDRDENITIFDELVETGLASSKQAEAVNKKTWKKYRLKPGDFTDEIADPAYWTKHTEKDGIPFSPQGFYADYGIYLNKGNNDRKAGAKVVYDGLEVPKEGIPRVRFTDNCNYCIDTIPNLPAMETDPEDIDTKSEDHGYDALRYGCMKILPSAMYGNNKKKTGWRNWLSNQKYKNSANSSWMGA
jgi:hypothetical protein